MAETKVTKNEIAAKSRQSGWGYIQITSSVASQDQAVTFPVPFDAVPNSIQVTLTGYRATASGAPTSLADFTIRYGNNYTQTPFVINASATGFTVSVSAGTSNYIGASYIGFSWTAEA